MRFPLSVVASLTTCLELAIPSKTHAAPDLIVADVAILEQFEVGNATQIDWSATIQNIGDTPVDLNDVGLATTLIPFVPGRSYTGGGSRIAGDDLVLGPGEASVVSHFSSTRFLPDQTDFRLHFPYLRFQIDSQGAVAESDETNNARDAIIGFPPPGAVWLRHYGIDLGDYDPAVDGDGDGFSAWQEAAFGTDPNDARSALRAAIRKSAKGGGYLIEWNAVPGSRQQLDQSTDLIFWRALGEPIVVGQRGASAELAPAPEDGTRYFRIRTLPPLDGDGDGLDSLEEGLLGTDPERPDTDGDGVNDSVEFALGFDPLIADQTTGPAIAAGQWRSFALKSDGSLWAWGINYMGWLGDNTIEDRESPHPIATDERWRTVACGDTHSLAIRDDGSLWAWGWNNSAQLGDGTRVNRVRPVRIGGDVDWKAIGAGLHFSVALKSDGSLWTWGSNDSGQLGNGTLQERLVPTRVGNASDWWAVAAGDRHVLALRHDGSLWAWGKNDLGQLGEGTRLNRPDPTPVGVGQDWHAITAGANHSGALRNDGSIWVWGGNSNYQLGNNSPISEDRPIRVGSGIDWQSIIAGPRRTFAVKQDGSLWGWGSNFEAALAHNPAIPQLRRPTRIGGDNDWCTAASGIDHSIAAKTDGSLWSWGKNSSQLGNGTSTVGTFSPIRVDTGQSWRFLSTGVYHALGSTDDGSAWAWGSNENGQLGDGTRVTRTVPVPLMNLESVTCIDAGFEHGVAVDGEGALWIWGDNTERRLGLGSAAEIVPHATRLGLANDWTCASAGGEHTLALKSDGTLWAWGQNQTGALGDGTRSTRTSPIPVGTANDWRSVVAGRYFSVGIRSDDRLWAWGDNSYGELGDNTLSTRDFPAPVVASGPWRSVAAGDSHAVALKDDGSLWSWGSNAFGQVGISSGTQRVLTPAQVGSDTDWELIDAGGSHTVAIKTDGSLWAWGRNSAGQLGDSTQFQRTSPVQVGTDTDWMWAAAAGEFAGVGYTLALKTDGSLWAWGDNQHGQLGIGVPQHVTVPGRIGSDSDWRPPDPEACW